jgi:hypothetical protein
VKERVSSYGTAPHLRPNDAPAQENDPAAPLMAAGPFFVEKLQESVAKIDAIML